jgi:hypothetical protein
MNIELQIVRLKKLIIKEQLYLSNGYEVPEYIKKEIKQLLNNIVIKDSVEYHS